MFLVCYHTLERNLYQMMHNCSRLKEDYSIQRISLVLVQLKSRNRKNNTSEKLFLFILTTIMKLENQNSSIQLKMGTTIRKMFNNDMIEIKFRISKESMVASKEIQCSMLYSNYWVVVKVLCRFF